MTPDELRDVDGFLGPEPMPPAAKQPCAECAKAERAVVLGAAVGGVLLGVAAAYLILRRQK